MSPPHRHLRVLDPGALTIVQDSGRPGWAHLGVPRSGWLDPPAATLANRLVGNPEDAAVLECLLGGLVVEVGAAMAVAVTGADCTVTVDGRPRPHGAAIAVAAGARVEVGQARTGLRAYVALAGGVAVEPVLGSRSTDTLSGLGPEPVVAGARLPIGRALGEPSGVQAPGERRPDPAEPVELRCAPGPRLDWFAGNALDVLCSSAYVVQPDSDRVGLRLAGAALERARGTGSPELAIELPSEPPRELPSEGIVLGAVQVPPDGQPLVFLADHPTTGGYPVVAVVRAADLARCAQLRPGDRVRFRSSARSPGPGRGATD